MIKESGIYKITNTIDNKSYIGCSSQLYFRIATHKSKLLSKSHYNIYLQNAVNKYGISKFLFEIIEKCDKNILYNREHHWALLFKVNDRNYGYNLKLTNPIQVNGETSNETKMKQSLIKNGKKHSLNHRRKTVKYLIHGIHNEEHYKNFISSRYTPVLQYDLSNNFIREFKSIKEANNHLNNGKINNIPNCCLGKQKTCCGFIWKYKKLKIKTNGNKYKNRR